MAYINPRGALRDYLCFELWIGCDFSWFEATLVCGRVPVSESCGSLTLGKNHKKVLISLLEALKDTTESQWAMNLLVYGLGSVTGL